jgi:ribosomal protein S18 acetylase RimI-like enzyme
MKINFQTIPENDLNAVLSIFKKAAEKIAKLKIDHWQYWHNPPKQKIDWVKDGLRAQEFNYIQDSSGNLLGIVRIQKDDLLYWGEQNEKSLYVHSFVIDDRFNHKGIGKIVLNAIAQKAKNENCQYLRLDADSKNPKLCSYYTKQGFTQVGKAKLPFSVYNLYQREV